MRCQKSILNSFLCLLIRQRTALTALSMSERYAASEQMEKTTESITKLPSFWWLEFRIIICPTLLRLLVYSPVFENRWNVSTKSMTIDFYDKQPLCVINSRIKKHPALISSVFPVSQGSEFWGLVGVVTFQRLTNCAGWGCGLGAHCRLALGLFMLRPLSDSQSV